MKRLLPVLMLAVLAVPAASLASKTPPPTVKLRQTSLGKILVKSGGFTLYVFTHDTKPNQDTCVKMANCATFWPPYTVKGKPTAGTGVNPKLLGTLTLPDGRKQVTYNGHALYGYKFDSGAGDTSYVGAFAFHGYWYAINAKGHEVK